ncbi:MAG: phosphoglycerate dehydrogenase [Phycisphaerae bacterium]|nr:phosphoglycerate dehydrogenase [Phycisphaerae bacterium]
MVKVLVADKLAEAGLQRLREAQGVEVDVRTGLNEDELAAVVGGYDGMIIRSGVKITQKVLASPGRLRAVARAGVGVDNVDIEAATRAGILVMNTPDANTLATAELTMAMMLALARRIPAACRHVKDGLWQRSDYVGTQLSDKTLGIAGLGRIGRSVATRALGFGMKVLAYDPFYRGETALEGRVRLVETLKDLVAASDYVTLHAALSDETRGMINADVLTHAKDGLRIINCARGALVDEVALAGAIKSGKVAGAAIDVYSSEPPSGNPLVGLDEVVCTPHLGASTREAQLAVTVEAVDLLLDYLLNENIRTAVNIMGFRAPIGERDQVFVDLGRRMSAILSSLCTSGIGDVKITTHGASLESLGSTLSRYVLIELLRPHINENVNLINAETIAADRGIQISVTSVKQSEDFTDNLVLSVMSGDRQIAVEGTVFGDNLPRVLAIDGYRMDMVPEGHMIIIRNDDKPGVIGLVGTLMGERKVNIADMTVSRREQTALIVLKIDAEPPQSVIDELLARTPPIQRVRTVSLPPLERNGR